MPDEFAAASDYFARALVWATEATTLVEMGRKLKAMLLVMRPELIAGMAPDISPLDLRTLREVFAGIDPLLVGKHYRRQLSWCRRSRSLSQMGLRTFAMIYVMRRDLLGRLNTNAAIAGLQNKTRQAFNRLVGHFRDCFRGFRNGVMRDEGTRLKCQDAQTKH